MSDEKRMPVGNAMKAFFMLFLSAPVISRFFGRVVALKHPRWLAAFVIRRFIRMYDIDTSEVKKAITDYPSLSAFFIRKLKPEARPVDKNPDVIASPVDGLVMTSGKITDSLEALQIKGRDYSLEKLVPEDMDLSAYRNGRYVQLYLSPRDYHRIHFAFDSRVSRATYRKGRLLPVNPFSLSHFKNVFPENERIILELEHESHSVLMVLVGALNVGRIGLSFSDFETNRRPRKDCDIPLNRDHGEKGDELGWFMMGSTVVLFFPENMFDPAIESGATVRVGQAIGKWM
ncbi:MAG: phosphatidylserine decarboxylase [Acidobacteria bacterium]|nr:phosphatidylserine decarboxylase [Acidobacteriota bacterium]